tara:strand:+ start:1187 stop:2908 length:1722 start_codon:yes stop_codon:yes gene_type:complete
MSTKEALEADQANYKHKTVINQKGASIEFDNSTGKETVAITNYHGSNIKITPQVTSEYAKENKQTLIVNDSFETVRNDKHVSVDGNYIEKIVGSKVHESGFKNEEQVQAIADWKEAYTPVAERNSQFTVLRGGESYPNGVTTPKSGNNSDNPSKSQEIYINVDRGFPSSSGVAVVNSSSDEVTSYSTINRQESTFTVANPKTNDFGNDINPATERGEFEKNSEKEKLGENMTKLQDQKLTDLEKKAFASGPSVGGDDQSTVFRNKNETVGITFNSYPSIRFDDTGRSQPGKVEVGKGSGAYVKIESIPHVEEVDNSKFPVGTSTLTVGNQYNVIVGSGGINIKTSGSMELGATTYKVSSHKISLNASKGVHINSENIVELQSAKNISLRSNKQVYVEPSLGVKNNLVVGGGAYLQGETYLHHVTAPAEIQQTRETTAFGKLVSDKLIGRVEITGGSSSGTYDVKAVDTDDTVELYPHSHHFLNLPLRLTPSGSNIRNIANSENINVDGLSVAAQPIQHANKIPTTTASAPRALAKENDSVILPNDRSKVDQNGNIIPGEAPPAKDGSFAAQPV